jgi:hypothetical protein
MSLKLYTLGHFLRCLEILGTVHRSRSDGLNLGGTFYKELELWIGAKYLWVRNWFWKWTKVYIRISNVRPPHPPPPRCARVVRSGGATRHQARRHHWGCHHGASRACVLDQKMPLLGIKPVTIEDVITELVEHVCLTRRCASEAVLSRPWLWLVAGGKRSVLVWACSGGLLFSRSTLRCVVVLQKYPFTSSVKK